MPILQNNITKAGNSFFTGSLTFICMHKAPTIMKETTRAAGKTKMGIHTPKQILPLNVRILWDSLMYSV